MGFKFGDPVGHKYNKVNSDPSKWLLPSNKLFPTKPGVRITFPCTHYYALNFKAEGDYDWDNYPVCPKCNPGASFIAQYRPKDSNEWQTITIEMEEIHE